MTNPTETPDQPNVPEAQSHPATLHDLELRFSTTAEVLRKIGSLSPVRQAATGRARSKSIETRYFDTATADLQRNSYALAVRKNARRFEQIVIPLGEKAEDIFRRRGTAFPTAEMTPGIAALFPVDGIGPLLANLPDATMHPVFRTEIRRAERTLNLPDGCVALLQSDSGKLIAEGGEAEICDVELKLVSGPTAPFFAFAKEIVTALPLSLEHLTKAERGYALVTGETTVWRKAGKVPLVPDHTVEEALAVTLKHCLSHMLDNQACARADAHPEGVHQMRVAIRRMRSALTIHKPLMPPEQLQSLATRLKALINAMGPARDWDVFTGEIAVPPVDWCGEDADMAELMAAGEARRVAAYAALNAFMDSSAYPLLLLDLLDWIESRLWRDQPVSESAARLFMPAKEFAGPVLSKRHKSARKKGKHIEHLTIPERHELRIAIKKNRYACEFFAALFPEKTVKSYLSTLSGLQDYLGLLNDVAVADELVRDLADSATGARKVALARAGGFVSGWYSQAAMAHDKDLFEGWDRFGDAIPFWR
ncbi:MAG: CHAD domain-containing protein [Magnetospiraceae bacterium]